VTKKKIGTKKIFAKNISIKGERHVVASYEKNVLGKAHKKTCSKISINIFF